MATYETESGFVASETMSGLDIYEGDRFVCTLSGRWLEHYRDENGWDIDDDALEEDIKEEIEVEEFIDYQSEYC